MKNKAVFLDRDNTLIIDKGYVYKVADLKWREGAKGALAFFSKIGYKLIVITNQSGVARGYYTEEDVVSFHKHMNEDLLKTEGCRIDQFYFSPFHLEGTIEVYRKDTKCRKPGDALFKQAINDFNISISKSIAIGDKYTDLQPGLNCGIKKAYLIKEECSISTMNYNNIKVVSNWAEVLDNIKNII